MGEATGSDQALDYLYKEYVRLAASLEQFVRSSFDDFKLLGAVGFVAAWPPLADWLNDERGPSRGLVLFGGFSVILVIVAIIATRDLLKQSIMEFHLLQMREYERAIKRALGVDGTAVFVFTSEWTRSREETHRGIGARFVFFFLLVLILFPLVVLVVLEATRYAVLYAALAIVVFAVYASARRTLASGARVRSAASETAAAAPAADRR